MAAHRKPRTRIIETAVSSTGGRAAVGMTTAALASATFLSQTAQADDRPTLAEVQKQVDHLYHQAEAATERYNAAKEESGKQRLEVGKRLDEVAEQTQKVNDARRELGQMAAEQYRTGGATPTETFMLSDDPQQYFDQTHLMDRLTDRQKSTIEDFRVQQTEATKKRTEASKSLETLNETQAELKTSKETVQTKLGEARDLLDKLTAEEKARLAELERQREAEAQAKAEEAARQAAAEKAAAEKAAAEKAAAEEAAAQEAAAAEPAPTEPAPAPAPSKADQVMAFAEAQLGKPYVWGATGPDSYDCSGLTQAAWKAAGVTLPRTTYDQVNVGTTIAKADMQPGDLVFFYDDISHVGIYAGGGQMIHAPKPGANVRYESVDYMPFYSAVRPG
ncbi:hypothetical protein SRB5_65350 [Streptomyces sp. RB5]|uniref:NlpC/P60 domain-containing protein n=1 Tax=Streptomyces smaragdinus TaxID=2585196 RepID=A0A7K0CS63_9ACTN|nr:C40 family peptidase [Streptomyces smaragdinus]MQY16337.1 hypothetical protein [Streptomyces smaragdinus]